MEKLVYSTSPHARGPWTSKQIMINVCIALTPACIVGCVFFGWNALLVLALSCISAVASEIVFRLCQKVSFSQAIQEFDFSSLVTGMLVGMNLTSNATWFVPICTSVFAVVVVKMLFGGTGKNIVNPAIAGRIFAFIAFGATFGGSFVAPSVSSINSNLLQAGQTALSGDGQSVGILFGDLSSVSNLDLFLGTGVPGVIGETCALALIVGGIYLCATSVLNFRWPLVYVVTTGLVATMINGFNFAYFIPSILSGGLMLGAIFMATDYVTSPNTKLGNYVYFVLLGILTAVLRHFCQMEVVSFVILLGNFLVPLIDKYIVNKPFGYQKKSKEAKK